MNNLKAIAGKILKAKNILISGHINPDGDSIGSLLSLGLGLEKLGLRVYMLSIDGVPKRYLLLPGAKRIIKKFKKPVDLAISVDCGDRELLGKAFDIFKKAKLILEIDHHEFRKPFGDILYVDKKAGSVGEIIYILLKELGVKMDRDIAENLLTSIVVETNSFRLPNVRPLTFEICAEMIKLGVDFHKLVEMVFWNETMESAVLGGICLGRCKFIQGGRIAWSIVRKKDFNLAKGKDEDVDAVCDEMRSIKGVDIAILFREKSKKTLRVSLRSKGKINIAKIAEHYGGGGHFDVAGCHISNNPRTIKELLDMAKKAL